MKPVLYKSGEKSRDFKQIEVVNILTRRSCSQEGSLQMGQSRSAVVFTNDSFHLIRTEHIAQGRPGCAIHQGPRIAGRSVGPVGAASQQPQTLDSRDLSGKA